MISIVVPTKNEAENIPILFHSISVILHNIDYEIIVVDGSSDNTRKIVNHQKIIHQYPVKLVIDDGLGLAQAVVKGFKNASGEIIVVMDSDLQHPPLLIPELINKIGMIKSKKFDCNRKRSPETAKNVWISCQNQCNVVIASRYIDGGKASGLSLTRYITSMGAKYLTYLSFPKLCSIKDPLSGFFAIHRSVIDGIELNPVGYKILLEILIRGKCGLIKEIPYEFEARKNGKSNLNLMENWRFLKHLWRLKLS